MIRNGTDDVEKVWRPAFQHRAPATIMTQKDAAGISDGYIPDSTNGATHFYTPAIMPKKGRQDRRQRSLKPLLKLA